jgi:hypothetical protein
VVVTVARELAVLEDVEDSVGVLDASGTSTFKPLLKTEKNEPSSMPPPMGEYVSKS